MKKISAFFFVVNWLMCDWWFEPFSAAKTKAEIIVAGVFFIPCYIFCFIGTIIIYIEDGFKRN
jgi:hypothetical protein